MQVTDIAERIGPSVVGLGRGWGQGSGVVVRPNAMLTNAHVLRGPDVAVTVAGPDDVRVSFTVPGFLSRGDELGEVTRIVIRAWERMDRASGLGA